MIEMFHGDLRLETDDRPYHAKADPRRYIPHLNSFDLIRVFLGSFPPADFIVKSLKPAAPELRMREGATDIRAICVKPSMNLFINHVNNEDYFSIVEKLRSPDFTLSPVDCAYLANLLERKIARQPGRPLKAQSWKYMYAKYWLEEIDGEKKSVAAYRIAKHFGNPEPKVYAYIRQYKDSPYEDALLEHIEHAKDFPRFQELCREWYCRKFGNLLDIRLRVTRR